MSIIFDQYQRYKNAQILVNKLRKGNETFSILEVGANEHKNLEQFLPDDNIKYLDIELSEERLNDPQYILGDATNMDFEDGTFDVIVALDVFEHIPPEKREMFLTEINRVSRVGFIIGAPFNTEGVADTEVRVNEVFCALYGMNHPWLIEHIENGLPSLEDTVSYLNEKNIKYEMINHGSLLLWEKIMKMHFFSIKDVALQNYVDRIYDLYNKDIFEKDYTNNCYRHFIVGLKDETHELDVKMLFNNKETSFAVLDQAETTFYKIYEEKTIEHFISQKNPLSFQVYTDKGEGITEKNSIKEVIVNDKINKKIDLNKYNVRTLRIDLTDAYSIIKVNEVVVGTSNGNKIDLTSEICGRLRNIGQNMYLCDDDDLQFIFSSDAAIEYLYVNIEATKISVEQANLVAQIADSYEKKESDLYNLKKEKNNEIEKQKREYEQVVNTLNHNNEVWQSAYSNVTNSLSWKVTAPIRKVIDVLGNCLVARGLRCLKEHGVAYTWHVFTTGSYSKGGPVINIGSNKKRFKHYILSTEEEQKQRDYEFKNPKKFSILVPLYNTKEEFLRDMIESVQNQTYGNWELCLADGSDLEHAEVETICQEYLKNDDRICYKKLEKNGGISENTNACLEMATGDFIALFDHDDILHKSALFEVMKTIEENDADMIYTDEATFHKKWEDAFLPHFKPDYSPDTLRSYNYICHLTVFSRELYEKIGGFNKEYDGSQDYDFILRLTEKAKNIVHIPKVLYYWRAHENSVASDLSAKPYTIEAAKNALAAHLDRVGLQGKVEDSSVLSTYKINYEIIGQPKVSILIPNKDHIDDLEKCIKSILKKTTYQNYEIIIIENNSEEDKTFAYYDYLKKNDKIKVVYWEREFNYSAINNFGAKAATGEYLLLLNNDVEIITEHWIEEMLMFAQRKDVGAVGAMLYYPDDTIQHAGVILGIGGVAGHSHKYFKKGEYGYSSRLTIAQNLSCVTAACLMIKKEIFDEVKGLDEGFAVAFNDVDFCMKVREAGYLNVFTPYAQLYHYESKSRGLEDTKEKQQRFKSEIDRFYSKWDKELSVGDPYYNVNLTLDREDFSYKG